MPDFLDVAWPELWGPGKEGVIPVLLLIPRALHIFAVLQKDGASPTRHKEGY